jgi:hypothetical protein
VCSTWPRSVRPRAPRGALADYGAEVVKVGPVPRAGAVQIVPPYYAYSGNRAMPDGRCST